MTIKRMMKKYGVEISKTKYGYAIYEVPRGWGTARKGNDQHKRRVVVTNCTSREDVQGWCEYNAA